MAEMLKANGFKEYAANIIKENMSQHEREIHYEQGKIEVDNLIVSKAVDTKTIQEES